MFKTYYTFSDYGYSEYIKEVIDLRGKSMRPKLRMRQSEGRIDYKQLRKINPEAPSIIRTQYFTKLLYQSLQ